MCDWHTPLEAYAINIPCRFEHWIELLMAASVLTDFHFNKTSFFLSWCTACISWYLAFCTQSCVPCLIIAVLDLVSILNSKLSSIFNFWEILREQISQDSRWYFSHPRAQCCLYADHMLHWNINGLTGHPSTLYPTGDPCHKWFMCSYPFFKNISCF